MSKRSTSNDALCLTTVSKTTLRICESMRCPSASTTSLCTPAFAMSGKNRERERRLDVVIALRHLGERAIEHRLRTLLERRDERQPILAELRELQDPFDVDAVLGVRGGDLREDARLVVDGESHVMRRDEVAADLVEGRRRSARRCRRTSRGHRQHV